MNAPICKPSREHRLRKSVQKKKLKENKCLCQLNNLTSDLKCI